MQLIYFGMLLSVFSGWMLDDFVEYPASAFCLSWCLGLVGVFGVIAKLLAWNLDRGSTSTVSRKSSRSQLMTFEWRSQAWLWIWAGLAPCYLAIIGWGDFIESIIPKWNSAAMIIAGWCFPSILLLTLIDVARFQLQSSLGARASLNARHGWLLAFVPCFVSCLLWDILIFLSDFLFTSNAWSTILAATTLILLTTVLLPYVLSSILSTEKMPDGVKRSCILDAWQATNGNPRAIRHWKTNRTIASAMIIGIWRRHQLLLLSDLLLERLDHDELRLIVYHESAHVVRRHAWLRMLPSIVLILPLIFEQPSLLLLSQLGIPSGALPLFQSVVILGSVAAMLGLLTRVARWTELDADRMAVLLAVQGSFDFVSGRTIQSIDARSPNLQNTFELPQGTLASHQTAARVLIRSLEKLTPRTLAKKESWLHPSLERRVKSLEKHYSIGKPVVVESIERIEYVPLPFDGTLI
ncbi:MAG: M48 family metalloprotease [Pirellulaceae bacterium]|nr:M48 family metalloprotease [Pirellulaceae bacterium]